MKVHQFNLALQKAPSKIAQIMESITLLIVVTVWFFVAESQVIQTVLRLKHYRPTPDIRVGLNAMKNFGRFAIIFAVLYWVQVQYGDAEAWFDAFQRN